MGSETDSGSVRDDGGLSFGVADFAATEPLENAARIVGSGMDFIECGLAKVVAMDAPAFDEAVRRLERGNVTVRSMNWFLPPSLRVTGPDTDPAEQRAFLETAVERALRLGARAVVFGSPASRSVPEGFPVARAWGQMVEFCRLCAAVIRAAGGGLRIGVEHVNRTEGNFLCTFPEALRMAQAVDRPEIGVTADFYHLAMEREAAGSVRSAGDLLCAVQFANPDGRRFPRPGDRIPGAPEFFEGLRDAGYRGGVAIEAAPGEDLEADCRHALAYLRAACGPGGIE